MITIQAEVNVVVFPHIVKMLEKVNGKAAKLGAVPFTIENQKTFTILNDKKEEVIRTSFEVVGDIPVISGWIPVANIDHVEGIVNGTASPKYVAHANCEHCNQNRQRNITYILKNSDGKLIQVGKTCLRDFLGHDPSAMLSYWHFIETLQTFCDENSGSGSGIATMELIDVLAIAIARIKEFGYVSRKKADETGYSTTGSDVGGIYFSKREQDRNYVRDAYLANAERAKELIEWVESKEVDPDNSYWANLKAIVDNEYCTYKTIGYAVSIIPTHFREMEVQREKETRLNEYFGNVGDKLKDKELSYVKSVSFDGYYGTTHMHFFKDNEGRCFKWTTGNCVECNVGDIVKASGSIKAHELYKDLKQTVLTRAKVKA